MTQTNFNNLADFIFELGTLRNIKRMHSQVLPNSNDTIASHSFRTAMIAYLLADMEGVKKEKVLEMALFHDMAETRTGDANFIHHFYVEQKEEQAYQDQTANVPNGKHIEALLKELGEYKTKEAIVAKDADTLDQLFLEREVLSKKPEDFIKWHKFSVRKLKTKSAKKLAETLKNRNPMQWFYNFDEDLKKN